MSVTFLKDRLVWDLENTLLPELLMIGWSRFTRAQASLAPHAHNAYEICYIIRGSVEWWVGNEVYEVGPGEVYVTRPAERHGGLDAMMHPNELYWMQFVFPATGPLLGLPQEQSRMLRKDYAALKLRTFPGSLAIPQAFARLLAEHRAPGKYAAIEARAALLQILISTLADHARSLRERSEARSEKMSRALAWMDGHLAEDYSIETLAELAELSVSHFYARFAKEVGFTPAEYRTRLRVRRAKQLLRRNDRSITDVAYSLGFSSSQYFATVFKNFSGLSPQTYRSLHRATVA